jgi:hypothetical protein
MHTAWFIRKGFLNGIVDNLRDALEKQNYCQLKHCLAAYCNITPFQILEHLNNWWCPLAVQAKKELWKAYYSKWYSNEHIIAFGKCLNNNQKALIRLEVTIPDDNKLQFYLKEIYDSNKFDEQYMLTWEQSSAIIKTNFDQTKAYFEKIVKGTNVYKQNTGDNSMQCNTNESANQMTNYGNKLWEWIQQIASNGAYNELATNTQATNKIASMEAEIKKLTAAIAQMADKRNISENVNPNASSGDWPSRCPQNKKPRNRGGYCHSHGYHPIGDKHTSANCSWKKDCHKEKQRGPAPLVETHSGHLQSMLQSISKTTPHDKANQLPPVDRDQGQHYIQRQYQFSCI